MKISDLLALDEAKKKPEPGTYAAARLSDDTKKKIAEYLKANKIPNPLDPDEMHCTLLYSTRPCPNYKAAGEYDKPKVAKSGKFEIWPNRDKTKNVLVYHVDCPAMSARHRELMDEHNAKYDFPDYKPHVTFSYDFGDGDVSDLADVDFPIEFAKEYQEDIDPDW